MLVGCIKEATFASLTTRVQEVDASQFDLLEIRFDACQDLDVHILEHIPSPLPAIFTVRPQKFGGSYPFDENSRLSTLEKLLQLSPAYMDVEDSFSYDQLQRLHALSPTTKFILSHYVMDHTPDDLDAILKGMRQKHPGAIYRVVCLALNTVDTLRMMLFCRQNTPDVIGICMGPFGITSRILAPTLHAGFTYCPVGENTANPEQVDAKTLFETYNFHHLNKNTVVYGLIGEPIEQSLAHIFHNKHNKATGSNVVFAKWCLNSSEMPQALPLLYELGVAGLSVTMPLKQQILQHARPKDTESASFDTANTLRRTAYGWEYCNTIGDAVLASIGLPLDDKRVVILGAGGTAKGILASLRKKTSHITIFNRSTEKMLPGGISARPLQHLMDLQGVPYDIIINTLPFHLSFPFEAVYFHPGALALEVSYFQKSYFLELAARNGCYTLDGLDAFTIQSRLQREYWKLPSAQENYLEHV